METKNREKMLLIAVAVCIGLLVVNYLIINPLTASYSARQDKIKDLKAKFSTGTNIMASAQSIESQWNRMRTNTLSLNGTVTEGQLFKAFQAWSTSSQVVLVSQKPQSKDSDDPAYSNEEIHVDVTGNLTQIFNFLYSVESGPLGLRVDSLDLASRDDAGRQLALGLTVSGLILNPDTNTVASNK